MLNKLNTHFKPIPVKKLLHLLFLVNSTILIDLAPTSTARIQHLKSTDTIIMNDFL